MVRVVMRKGTTINPIDVHIGKRLALARQKAQRTQREIANTLGVGISLVSDHEHGASRLSALQLRHYALLYRVSANWLLGLEEDVHTDEDVNGRRLVLSEALKGLRQAVSHLEYITSVPVRGVEE